MTAFPPQIPKLIPRLASTHDGEVVATARAIQRILKTAGLDWHSLAKHVDSPTPIYGYGFARPGSPSPPPRRHPDPPPPPRQPKPRGWSDMERQERMVWCDAILATPTFDIATLRFVADVREKLHQGIMFQMNRAKIRKLTGLINVLKEQGRAA